MLDSSWNKCPFCGGEITIYQECAETKSGYDAAKCHECGWEWFGATEQDVNTRESGWVDPKDSPNVCGKFLVDSSYGVTTAIFTSGFTEGDYRWQCCVTGNDEGMENMDGLEFEVYGWMNLPESQRAPAK